MESIDTHEVFFSSLQIVIDYPVVKVFSMYLIRFIMQF